MVILRWFFLGLFVLCSTYLLFNQSMSTPRILVLQSYGTDYSWTRGVDEGIKSILDKKNSIKLRWYYMNTKNYPEKHYLEKVAGVAKSIIDQFNPNIIIAVDDNAQEYVAKHYINDPKIKIVFAGISASRELYGYDKANNVTGISEHFPLEGLVDTLQLLRGRHAKVKVIFIGDESSVAKHNDKYLHQYCGWKNIEILNSTLVSTFDDWKRSIKKACKTADYIIVAHYRKIYHSRASEEKVRPSEIMKWTLENSTIPVIGLHAFVFEDGAHLAIATSPQEQGRIAATFAVDIIKNGVLPSYTQGKEFVFGINKQSIMAGGEFFGLSKVYESFARYTKNFTDFPKN